MYKKVAIVVHHPLNLRSAMAESVVSLLPPEVELETRAVLKALVPAHRYLAELKALSGTIPNEHILINTLAPQEAKDSSAIETVIPTH